MPIYVLQNPDNVNCSHNFKKVNLLPIWYCIVITILKITRKIRKLCGNIVVNAIEGPLNFVVR